MKNNKKHIDDLFKDELSNYAETPPPAAWDALQKRMNVVQQPRVSYRWAAYFAVASLLLLLSVSVAKKMGEPVTTAQNELNGTNTAASGANNAMAAPVVKNDPTVISDNTIAKKVEITTSIAAASNTSGNTTQNTARNKQNSAGNRNKPTVYYASAVAAKNGKAGSKSAGNAAQEAGETSTNEWNASANNRNNGGSAVEAATGNAQELAAGVKDVKGSPAPGKKGDANTGKQSKKDDAIVKETPKAKFNRIEAGLKAGFETGLNNDAARKIVAAPYIQFNITPRLSFMVQPAAKSSYLNTRRIGNPESYYSINPGGQVSQVGSSTPIYIVPGAPPMYLTKYHYSETHDSIVKSYANAHTYLEFEIPLLAKYKLSKSFSVYGGVNMAFGKAIKIAENTFKTPGINKTADSFAITATPAQATPPPIRSVINYAGTPYSSYTGPLYPADQGTAVRLGYMIGFSYEYEKRWLFDALMQQGNAKTNNVGGFNINTALSAPYVRLMLGYKLTK